MIKRSRVWILAGVAGEFSSPGSVFCADSYFSIQPTSLFLISPGLCPSERSSSSASSFCITLIQVIDGVMPLALYLLAASHAEWLHRMSDSGWESIKLYIKKKWTNCTKISVISHESQRQYLLKKLKVKIKSYLQTVTFATIKDNVNSL